MTKYWGKKFSQGIFLNRFLADDFYGNIEASAFLWLNQKYGKGGYCGKRNK